MRGRHVARTAVRLFPLTAENWRECADLAVADHQHAFVPSNLQSTRCVKVFRVMIAAPFQRRGFGRAAMGAVIEEILARWNPSEVYVSFQADNVPARRLYASMGFDEVEREGSKVTACRPANHSGPGVGAT